MSDQDRADRRMTYVMEPEDDEEERWRARLSYPSSRRLTFVPVPSTPLPTLDSDDSFIDGWCVEN
ncbi:MAG: hypothetical protein JST00_35715 [Deltaproteobacteria bacterium]|nr:hypothetical protein [Deltaproteobacteria bacterium]